MADARLPGGFVEIEQGRTVQRSSYLNSSEPSRAARAIDPVDLDHAREIYSANIRLQTPAKRTNQLTAYSAVNFKPPSSRQERRHPCLRFAGTFAGNRALRLTHRARGARLAFGLEHARPVPQKENQC